MAGSFQRGGVPEPETLLGDFASRIESVCSEECRRVAPKLSDAGSEAYVAFEEMTRRLAERISALPRMALDEARADGSEAELIRHLRRLI